LVKAFSEILGEEVDIPERPGRIVSFSPAITEALFLLGFGDSIVGVSAFCARPPEAAMKRKVGSYSTVDPQLLSELRPDVIFTVTGYQREFAIALSKRFPVYPLELPVSVAGIIDGVTKLGLVLGAPERGRELASRLLRKLSGVRQVRTKLRTYVEIDLGGPVSFGAYSYITDALHLLGASNIYGGVRSEWLTPSLGEIPREDPDVFLYEAKMFSKFIPQKLEELIDRRGWRESGFVRNGNYFLTPGPLDFLAHHGPSFITEAIPWLEERLESAVRRV
jgi:iron complex transport system substrate-binding protein